MSVKLKVISGGESSVIELPDRSQVTISESGEVTVELAAKEVDYEALSHMKGGPERRTTIAVTTTGHEPPASGNRVNLTVCIHEPDPADPEVRPVAKELLLIGVNDPSPGLRRSRKVEFEIEASEVELERIEEYRKLDSFTFSPCS